MRERHSAGHPRSVYYRNGRLRPEYKTVYTHWYWVYKSTVPRYRVYKKMPFHLPWNPKKGGSIRAGMLWIIENLGRRPGSKWSLDIVERAKGFVPGNLRWAQKSTQNSNQRFRILGKYSVRELRIELRRHGYKIIKIQ